EGVKHAQTLAQVEHAGDAEGSVGADVDDDVGPGGAEAADDVLQVVISPQGSMGATVSQRHTHNQIVVGAGDDQGQVLVVVVVVGPEGQLLMTVRGVIDGVEVDGQVLRRFAERGDELVNEQHAQAFQGGDVDLVLETRQGGLAGQVGLSGPPATDELEDRVAAQSVDVVLLLVVGEDAVDALADHCR